MANARLRPKLKLGLNAVLPTRHDVINLQGGGSGLPRVSSTMQPITSVYPNPATHQLNLVAQPEQATDLEVQIYDLRGSRVLR